MDVSAIVSHFRMSPSEEEQFRLNLENETYSAVLFDRTVQKAIFASKSSSLFCPERYFNVVKHLLTRDIKTRLSDCSSPFLAGKPIVALAMAAGMDPGYQDSVLSYAVQTGSENLVNRLLDLGANPDPIDGWIVDPLTLAIKRGLHSIVELLIRRGARINQHLHYTTPLGIAVGSGDLVLVARLLDLGADPDFPCNVTWFRSPLEIAINNQNLEACRLLLSRGADPNFVYHRLALAEVSPLTRATAVCEDKAFEQLLLEHGAKHWTN